MIPVHLTGELERNAHPGAGLKRYYRVMELALECRTEEVVEVALAQLQKLIGECQKQGDPGELRDVGELAAISLLAVIDASTHGYFFYKKRMYVTCVCFDPKTCTLIWIVWFI